jgi:hypothetical protein
MGVGGRALAYDPSGTALDRLVRMQDREFGQGAGDVYREELALLRAEVARLRAELASAENCYYWRRNDCTPNDSE